MKNEFIQYLRTNKGYSEHTARAYSQDITDFVQWSLKNRVAARWSTTEKADIDNYVQDMQERGLAATTIGRRVSSLRSFFQWAVNSGKLATNPAKYVASPKREETLPEVVETEKIHRALESTRIRLVTKLEIAIMAETGIRLQECLDLRTQDIDTAQHSMTIRGKGNKQRTVFYGKATEKYLKEFIPKGYRGILFVQTQREVRWEIYQAMGTHPHALRHTFASAMLNNGASLSAIQWQLGHKTVQTTERYAKLGTPAVRQQYVSYAPSF